MKGNQLLRKEFTEIIKSKKILIPIIAVLFVPILYAGMFLWAFWDPYKQLDDLPVAVVNLDKGAVFDGKPIEVGKGLVDNLKDNKSFKWEFVSEKEAKKGMEGRKYYMLVRIPDDFSSNATTLLKDNPKPLNLEYIPNESLNFLSSQIGGTAIEKIKGEVASTLTKTYAEKMFDSIQDVSKGLADGAEGANKLHDGSSELHDGSSKVTDGLHTLQGKSGEMKDGVQKLADGSNKLVDGSGKVTNGLNTLNSKTGEMQIGIGKLVDGSGKVTDGLHVLNSNAGIGKLVDGSGKVTDGLHALNSNAGIGKLVDGSGKVTDGLHALNSNAGIGKLVDGSGKVTDGLNTLNSKTGELRDGSEKVTGGLNKLVSKSGELKTGTTDLSNGMGKLVEGQSQLEEGSQAIQKGLQELNSNVQKSAAGLEEMQSKVPSILNTVNEKIDGAGANVNQLNELTQSTAGDAKNAAQEVANLQKQIESLPKEYQEQLQPFVTSAVKSTATVQQKAAGVAGGTNKLNEEVKQVKVEIHQTTNGLQNKLPNPAGIKTLAGGIEKLTNAQNEFVSKFHGFGEGLDNAKIGADKLKDGSVQLIDGVTQLQSGSGKVTAGLGQLSAGVNQLADGSGQVTGGLGTLSVGVSKLADGSGQVTGGLGTLSVGVTKLADGSSQVTGGLGTLSAGVNQLADGSGQVTGGLGTLSAGANQMAGGVNQLANGSSQVTGGLGTLFAGANQMAGGVNQLADGSGQVTDGLGTLSVGANQMAGGVNQLADGSNQVTTGLGTLNGGLNKMSTGSTQLIDGVNKLADGSGKVTDGLVKVNDGSGELAEKLGEGAEKTGEVKGTDKTYDMFASPVKVKTEKMAEVPNYGTGFTPYFLSLGLFVGALLLSIVYPLRDTVGVPKSGFSWFISKFGVLLSVGIIQAIVADVILLFGLGVEVQSIPYFILFSIITSLAFIALIQCLVTAFGDAGRFIAIITLIMQLTTSAGTFPLELIPKFLQPFNAWLPMTYSVSGLKAVVSSGDFDFMWQNVGVLMIFIVVLSLGTIASLTWMHKRQFRNIAENQSIEA
ncbi:phage infection protein [Bacillus cereus]|uniref:YhgE/Pip domain-containing protein n=1 Tax=Bacillus cereus TaxID=1396 RepID=UPI000771DA77|nr:YhgE/Pip domain-containing protein [Bacillus cereus]KXI38086.1 phage infection protein [Bacillus cereus]MEB9899787.1 YhgE/Pip domain-containing protein [Bacillus cereus]MEC0053976.1 YhgE/Pip domain-containing protein [Bacillus cereus]MEC0215572.1 YhgE/Pip domain-containing protein [Bacillus cereus]MEC2791309.1 YhgE/Pip domain-containing protein [Bacillus cereus]